MIYISAASICIFRLHVAVLSLLLIMGNTALGAENAEFKGTLRTETTNGSTVEVPFWAGAAQLRMDITRPMAMTVVWSFGADPSMRMIRHDDRVYVEWGPKQLENARQMVQSANQGKTRKYVDSLNFEATGAGAAIEGWDAFEVRLLTKESEDGSRLWLTRDTDYGLAKFFAHYARALHETTQFPMVGTDNDPLGLSDGTSLPLEQLANAGGLDGHVVRIIDVDHAGETAISTTITLHSIESGPFTEDLFDVPDGYVRRSQLSIGVN